MDRKEGGGFWCAQEGGTEKQFFFNLKTNKQTNKQTNKGFKSLVSLTFFFNTKQSVTNKKFTIKSKIYPSLSTHYPSALLRHWFQCSLLKNVAR
jgi:hypothetical protein